MPRTATLKNGSSPRVRGTRCHRNASPDDDRIIPACAGNTCVTSARSARSSDHPRVCGEHMGLPSANCIRAGSSPRVRGTLAPPFRTEVGLRIIPACAGNTHRNPIVFHAPSHHPRVCGEHPLGEKHMANETGSSPRVRGTLPAGHGADRSWRIIPACAGNTHIPDSPHDGGADHPRVCGEHAWRPSSISAMRGSSPRVRGTPPRMPALWQ